MKERRRALACGLWGAAETAALLRARGTFWQGTASLAVFGVTLAGLMIESLIQGETLRRRLQEADPALRQLLERSSLSSRALLDLRQQKTLSEEARTLLEAYAARCRTGFCLFVWTAVAAALLS